MEHLESEDAEAGSMADLEEELLDIEDEMDRLHSEHLAKKGGLGAIEVGTPAGKYPVWNDFVAKYEDIFSEDEAAEIERLVVKMVDGELNDEGEEPDRAKLIKYMYRFRQMTKV